MNSFQRVHGEQRGIEEINAESYTTKGWRPVKVLLKPGCPCGCGRIYGGCEMLGPICYPPGTFRRIAALLVLAFLLPGLAGAAQYPEEGGPGWDCRIHGNQMCGPAFVNVNTAAVQQIELLPYVGPKLAAAIVSGRPYKTREAVCNVPRVPCGPKRSVLPWVRISGDTTAKSEISGLSVR